MPKTIEPDNYLSGGMYGKTAKEQLVFPLKHTEVKAKIAGNLSRVEVTQTFENPLSEPLEAVYVFPLPDEAAVDDMEIKIGDRTLKGNIKKCSEAQQIYLQAQSQGCTAGLLEQQRDNIFTQSLANIRPGEQIDVTIRYTVELSEDVSYEEIFGDAALGMVVPKSTFMPRSSGSLDYTQPSRGCCLEGRIDPPPIEGVDTAIAGFIGFTEDVRNGAQIGKPMLVASWTQYLYYFAAPNSDGYTDFDAYLPFAVSGYFLNGGGRCWIVSIGTQLPGTPQATQQQIAGVQVPKRGNRPSLNFSLRAEQATRGVIQIVIGDSSPRPLPEGTEGEPPPNTGEYFSLQLQCGDEVLEQYDHLTMDPTPPAQVATYVVEALRDSMYVQIADEAQSGQPINRRPMNGQYELSPPLAITTTTPERFLSDIVGVRDDRSGLQDIFEIDEITMLACPDIMRAYEAGIMVHRIMELMITACETVTGYFPNRMVVLDSPHNFVEPSKVVQWLERFGHRRSMYATLYYPWIQVRHPRNSDRLISIPPCGHMMGVWARTDEQRGVHRAPVNGVLRGAIGLAYDVSYQEQQILNPLGINCIRSFPNRGIRVTGARTLVEPDWTEWHYINVRRLMNYIEKSIELGTQWAVFEPNDYQLWEKVCRTTTDFLERLWRARALVGRTPEEAFYVKCDGENNTPSSIKSGHLYIDAGVAPVRPSEFIVFRVSQDSGTSFF